MGKWTYESEELESTVDINGTEITIGDSVYYSGASTNKKFSIGKITRIENFKTLKDGKVVSSSIRAHFGGKSSRYPNQVIKKQ